jgi:transcription antitermination factor NusG
MNDWHVWTVVANRQKRIMKFLSELEGIEDFLYPMAEKEYNTKKGKRTKDVPIYSNYIFINYKHNPKVSAEIEKCPWISNYVGKCSAEEMSQVQEQNRRNYDDLVPVEQIEIGTVVKLVKTPFAGWEATIVDVEEDKLSVSISILGAERVIKCNIDDVNVQ